MTYQFKNSNIIFNDKKKVNCKNLLFNKYLINIINQ